MHKTPVQIHSHDNMIRMMKQFFLWRFRLGDAYTGNSRIPAQLAFHREAGPRDMLPSTTAKGHF